MMARQNDRPPAGLLHLDSVSGALSNAPSMFLEQTLCRPLIDQFQHAPDRKRACPASVHQQP
jgi:hypothetical protein